MYGNFNTARYIEQCNGCDGKGGGGGGTNPYRTLKPGSYHNPELGLISISYDGVDWITMADKNLGATEVWNVGDDVCQENSGNFYQRGNCYGFPFDESLYERRTTRISARNYGPGNYYNSNGKFFATNYYRDTSANKNLRGGGNDTLDNFMGRDATNYEDRQGPCPDGFHIPSGGMLGKLYGMLIKIYNKLNCTNYIHNQFGPSGLYRECDKHSYDMFPDLNDYIKLPNSGGLNNTYDWHRFFSTNGNMRSSSCSDETRKYGYYANKMVIGKTYAQSSDNHLRSNAYPIRPFKNEPVIPDETWIPLYVLS